MIPPHLSCQSEIGCRCVVVDGRWVASLDAHGCQVCATRDRMPIEPLPGEIHENHVHDRTQVWEDTEGACE